MNPFLVRIDRGELTSADQVRALYKAELKRLHPDLNGGTGPAVDFDRLRRDFDEACRALQDQNPSEPAVPSPGDSSAGTFLEEFRNLVARGFPVNLQAAAKNRAYAGSVRTVSRFLAQRFGEEDFFARVNGETRLLKRREPGAFWYVLQICWGAGDWGLTGFDFYRQAVARHRKRLESLVGNETCPALSRFLDFLVECVES